MAIMTLMDEGRVVRRDARDRVALAATIMLVAGTAVAMASPSGLAAIAARPHGLVVVLQTQLPAAAAGLMMLIVAVRVAGMLWIYFAAWNTWANEVALMALFLISPLIGVIVWFAARDSLARPPAGQ
jgi:hypothetical protein